MGVFQNPLKLISLYEQEYCSSKYIYYLIPGYKIKKKDSTGKTTEIVLVKSKEEFLSLWEKSHKYAKKAVERIMNVGDKDFGAIKYDFIPNTTIIPVLGAALWIYEEKYKTIIPEPEFNNRLSKWYWSAVFSGDYSGSSDTVMSEDYRDIKEWFSKRDINVIRRIQKVDRDSIANVDLKSCRKGSSLYNAILCLISLNKAEDFYTKRVLDTGTYRAERIHDHHIFPSQVKDISSINMRDFENTKDSIVNRTLLLDETNEKIKTKKPSQYLEEILRNLEGDEKKLNMLMEKHFISRECLDYLKRDEYNGFIECREKVIKDKLLTTLGVK